MQVFEDRQPNNGLNRDDEERLIPPNESRFILNARAGSSDSDNVGSIENIKGTTEVTFDLPDGVNKVIGSYGDQSTHSNFFFVWNSLNNHTIFRYFPKTRTVRILIQDTLLSFGEYDLINDIRVVDQKLLKWRDIENPPRKININKADVDFPEFQQTFNFYLGDNFVANTPFTSLGVTIKEKRYDTTSLFGSTTITLDPAITDKKELAIDVAAQINAVIFLQSLSTQAAPLSVDWEAEACGEFVSITITSNDLAFYSIVARDSSLDDTAQIVPQNHYQNYEERTIDEIKHPFHCEMKAQLKSDLTFHRNYISKKVFQFANRTIYDDDEKTTVDPHTISIYNKFICDQFSTDDVNNYIEIDLSVFPELTDPKALQTIKRIEIYVREGELGSWKSVTTLEQYEFVDTENQHFDFYNNGFYNTVDATNFVRPFDFVPLRSKNMEVAKNRTFFGNNLEGFDNVCVDADLDVTYDDVGSRLKQPTYNVSGALTIKSLYNGADNGTGYQRQPIWQKIDGDNPGTVWGGMSDKGVKMLSEKAGQSLVLDGFVVYLAGTSYRGISRQRAGNTDGSMTQNSNNVYVGTGSGDMEDILKDNMRFDPEMVKSDWSIPNVPDGWYMLRVASHLTTQEDLDSGDLGYQDTSTNVVRIKNNTTGDEGLRELLVRVQGGSIGNIQIDVMDLSHDSNSGSSKIMSGYVVDSDIQNPITTYNEFLGDTRISRARVEFNLNSDAESNGNIFANATIGDGEAITTDHNGFFFYASKTGGFGNNALNIEAITPNDVGGTGISYLGSIVASGLGSGKTSGVEEDEYTVVANRSPSGASSQQRAKVLGNVQDAAGLGIPKTTVVSQRTPPVITDSNGDYEFWHYAILDTSFFETDIFPVQTGSTCSARFTPQRYNFNFSYPTWYNALPNPTLPPNAITNSIPLTIEVPFFTGDLEALIVLNAMKRGWDGEFGIIYTDRGNRGGAVNSSEELRLHIPFYTEKDSEGNINPGVPIINWSIKHRPPEWATHWQWVRTKNLTVGSYFQWAIKSAEYQDNDGNITTFSGGTRLVLDFSNVATYREQNPGMDLQVSLNNETFRARFIKDSFGNDYPEYFDFKVLEVDGLTVTIEKEFDLGEVKAGTLIELYNELLDIENDIFYEFGECFEVGRDWLNRKYHKGLSQDQSSSDPAGTPATGAFRTGDAYYRFRGMPDGGTNTLSFIDDDAVSDFYFSEVESIGRPNAIDPDAKQLWKPSQIRHSGKYVPDSAVNNMNQFLANDFQSLPIDYGDIYKLQLAANILMSIHEFRWCSNYIEEGIVRKQSGTNEIIASTNVFDSFRAAKQITGTINQESVVEFRGNIWALDLNKGIVNRWGADGLTAISEYKMIDYFTDKSKETLRLRSSSVIPSRIIGVYDVKFDEYILSFSELLIDPITEEPGPIKTTSPRGVIDLDITNSESIDQAPGDTLISVKSMKDSGSVFIFNKSTNGELVDGQVDNKVDSMGSLEVKIRELDGSITEVAKLAQGQGIENLNISTGTFDYKSGSSDSSQKIPGTEVILSGETIAFSERLKKWSTFYSFRPEMFGIIDLEVLGFTEGKLWIHNDNDRRNNFYGIQYPSQVEVVSNIHPGQVKVFQAIGVESYHRWTVPSMKTPNGMETKIVKGRFVRREDSFFAPVPRDINSPGLSADENEAMVNGRQLRDRSATILLQNDELEEVTLFSVGIQHTLSPRHQV